jgi:hypothetical protein
VRQGSDDLPLHRDSMYVNFVVERLAEYDSVLCSVIRGRELVMIVEPKLNPIKKVEAGPIGDVVSTRLIVGAEEDGRGKGSLESLNDPPMMATVLGQAEEVKDLGSAEEADDTAFLLDRKCGYPDRNETVLAERKAEAGVTRDIKEELPVASGVSELTFWWAAQWDTAKDEGSGVVSQFLVAALSRLQDEADGFEPLKPELGETSGG